MSKEVMREVLHSMQNFQKLYGDSFFTDEIKQVKKLVATCQRCGEVNPAEIHTCTPMQREWRGLTKKEFHEATDELEDLEDCWVAIEAKLKEVNAQ